MFQQFRLRSGLLATWVALSALMALGAASGVSAEASSAATGHASGSWYEVSTDTFVLVANVDAARARELADGLEQFRHALEQQIPRLSPPPRPVTVYAFDSRKALRRYYASAPRGVGGVYLRSGGADVILVDAGTSLRQQHVYHEYVHFRLRSSFFALPTWLNEGLAYYYQTFRVGEDGGDGVAEVGGDVPGLGRNKKSVPLEGLLDTVPGSKRYATRGYSKQSWELVHYLMSREDAEAVLTQLLPDAPATQGASLVEATTLSLEQLESALKAAPAQETRRFNIRLGAASETTAPLSARPLQESDVQVHLAELEEAVGVNLEAAAASFEAALAQSPKNLRALLGSARALTAAGHLAEAEQRVTQALRRDPKSADTYLQRARIAMREFSTWRANRPDNAAQAMHPSLTRARGAFLQASLLDPTQRIAVRGYARTFLFDPTTRQPGIDACLNALQKGNDLDLALTLVELYSDDANPAAAHATRAERILPAQGMLSIHEAPGTTSQAWTEVTDALALFDRLLAERLYGAGKTQQALAVLRDASAWATGDARTRVLALLEDMSSRQMD